MSEQADRHRRIQERGVLLGTLGLLLAIAIAFTLQAVQNRSLSIPDLLTACAGVLGIQACNWLILRSRAVERLSWDPHYLIVPSILGAIALNWIFFFTPAANPLVFVAWVVALQYAAGLAGFAVVFGMSAVMTVGYLVVSFLFVERGEPISLEYHALLAVSFLVLAIYTGVIFERLKRDRTERRELRQQLSRLALTDPLTDLPNRRHFETVLGAELARIDRYGGSCSLAVLDVDHFKNYNDTLGHPAGDEVLRRLASLMKEHLRTSDFLARYGGEEFALLMVNTPRREAVQAVQRIVDAIEVHPFPNEHVQPNGNLTISAGIACAPENGVDPAAIINFADVALYDAKRGGRNRIVA